MTSIEEARAALDAKQGVEQRLADVTLCPPWRHAAFALVMAALVGQSGVPLAWRFVVLPLALLAIALIVQSDRRRLGIFINGYRRGRTRLVVFPLLAVVMALYAASFYFGVDRDRPALSLALGALTFVVAYAGSVLWQRVFVRELRG
jgi:hypothetical protein